MRPERSSPHATVTNPERESEDDEPLRESEVDESPREPQGYAGRVDDLPCGACGAPMLLEETEAGPLYVCSRFPACDGTHGAHPDGTPLGQPADAVTRGLRKECHRTFDRLWREGDRTRREAYALLQEITGLSPEEAHISRFDAATCRRVIGEAEKLLDPGDTPDR